MDSEKIVRLNHSENVGPSLAFTGMGAVCAWCFSGGHVQLGQRRLNESAGMLMIGDGLLGMLFPHEHCLLWRGGPQWWRNSIDWFASHPGITRVLATSEVAAGLWIARQGESIPAGNQQEILASPR